MNRDCKHNFRNKEIPLPVVFEKTGVGDFRCGRCSVAFIDGLGRTQYCGNCGQKLNWDSKSNEEKLAAEKTADLIKKINKKEPVADADNETFVGIMELLFGDSGRMEAERFVESNKSKEKPIEPTYNPIQAGDMCKCGHNYYSHFRSSRTDKEKPFIGCRYCDCKKYEEDEKVRFDWVCQWCNSPLCHSGQRCECGGWAKFVGSKPEKTHKSRPNPIRRFEVNGQRFELDLTALANLLDDLVDNHGNN
jgi:hypothetical protein